MRAPRSATTALLLVLAACPAPRQKGGDASDPAEPGMESSRPRQLHGRSVTPATAAGDAAVAELDRIDARIQALAYLDPAHCQDACLTGVERVELKRGVVSCRCRKVPGLGVHKLPAVARR